jgi:protocatechuate 3,4-dioxygenase beta subunit
MPSADPVLDMSLREMRAVLFEELESLPEHYRSPLVLCALEDKSLEEAARQLGWTKGTVKGRLQRGRELLRCRLRRRGLELPAGLFATALALHFGSAPVSAALADSTFRAAVAVAAGRSVVGDVVSTKVAALVRGASRAALLQQTKARAALVLLMALGLGLGAVALAAARPGEGAEPPTAPSPLQAKADAARVITVSGRVLDPEGQPVAGAELYLSKATPQGPASSRKATSGPDGRFRFTLARSRLDTDGSDSHDRIAVQVMAVARGHGCDWAAVAPNAADGEASELTLHLVRDVPISGRIQNPEGRPLAGARLKVTRVFAPRGDDVGGYLEAIRKHGSRYTFAKSWSGPLPGQPPVLTTGADGRFQLTGVGGERVVRFHLEGPTIATGSLEVMTRAGEKVGDVYGASFDCRAVASRPIRGVVRDRETRKPLAGVSVGIRVDFNPEPQWMTVTDQNGRYKLVGLARSPRYELAVKPPDGQSYFQSTTRFLDTSGSSGRDVLTADIEMVPGTLTVRGTVTDRATGKPVARARVEYLPLYPNPHVNMTVAGRWSPRSEVTTGPDGTYALPVLPGVGVIGVVAPRGDAYMPAFVTSREIDEFLKVQVPLGVLVTAIGEKAVGHSIAQINYHALVLIEPGQNQKDQALVCDVALERPQDRKGRVVGPDGQPLTGVTVTGLVRWHEEEILEGAEFTIRGINPRGGRPVIFHHKGKNLGFTLNLKDLPAEGAGPLTVKLQPCGSVSGRIVDQDGQPVAGMRTRGRVGNLSARSLEVTTDTEGRFHAEGLVPGLEYWIIQPNKAAVTLLARVTVEPGKHKDLGDLQLKEDN